VVDGLVTRGLVDRRHDEQDRRRVRHTITTAGQDLLAQADTTLEEALEEVLAHAGTASNRQTALDGLAAWHEALTGYRAAKKAAGVSR
jgi:DNA-binding MarR family transcriptional regulator